MPPAESETGRSPKRASRAHRLRSEFLVLGDGPAWSPSSWWQRFRRDPRSVSWGVGLSVLMHVVLAVLLALWIIRLPRRDDVDPRIINWVQPFAGGGPSSRGPRQLVHLPIELGPGTVIETPMKEQPSEGGGGDSAAGTGTGAGPDVKPVNVGHALKNRGGAGAGPAGETDDAHQAIQRGLDWLKRMQLSDGRWELHQGYPDAGSSTIKSDTGATGLALLAFLGDGHTHQHGNFTDTVDRGLKWLREIQDPETGDLHDMRYEEGREPAVFSHALATIALSEALALTGDERLREPVQRAVDYLLKSQHPEQGGWKYRPIAREANGDMAVTGWALMALHTARMAGIEVSLDDLRRSSGFLDSVQEQQGARYKFEPLNTSQYVTPPLTAEGILCRQWLGWPKNYPPHAEAVHYLLDDSVKPQWVEGKRNVYSWFFIAQVLHNCGGEEWQKWFPPTRDLIVRHQMKSGPPKVRGSWHPTQPEGARQEYGEKAGRLYVTAMCLLILETPTRNAPIYADE